MPESACGNSPAVIYQTFEEQGVHIEVPICNLNPAGCKYSGQNINGRTICEIALLQDRTNSCVQNDFCNARYERILLPGGEFLYAPVCSMPHKCRMSLPIQEGIEICEGALRRNNFSLERILLKTKQLKTVQ